MNRPGWLMAICALACGACVVLSCDKVRPEISNSPATPETPVAQAEITVCEGAAGSGVVINNGAPAANGRDFGARNIDAGASAPLTITVQNSGAADMSLGGPTLSGTDFSLDAAAMLTSLAPGATTSFTIAFAPASVGQKTATVSLI